MATSPSTPADEKKLPPLEDGDIVTIIALKTIKKETKPPLPYTEATLLEDMQGAAKFIEDNAVFKKLLRDKLGLGTAATRDSIIESLKLNGYITVEGKSLKSTPKAVEFIEWLEKVAPQAIDVALTAEWEAQFLLIEQEADPDLFNKKIHSYITNLIDLFKSSKPTSTTGVPLMSDTEKSGQPTDKMLNFAKLIASKMGVRVPDEVMVDWAACTQFINDNKDKSLAPSEKQINFAKFIADKKKVEIPAEALTNGMVLSKWIDANK